MAQVKVTVRSDSGKTTEASTELETPNAGARAGKAVGALVVGLAVAAASAIVPGPHLAVTIPGGVLGGLIGAWVVWNVRARVAPFGVTCPACSAEVKLEGGKVTAQMMEPCPECNRPLMLTVHAP